MSWSRYPFFLLWTSMSPMANPNEAKPPTNRTRKFRLVASSSNAIPPMETQMETNPMASITICESFIKNRSSWLNLWLGRTMVMLFSSGPVPSITLAERIGADDGLLGCGRTGAAFLLGAAIGIVGSLEVLGLIFHPLRTPAVGIFTQGFDHRTLTITPML